MMRNGHLLIKDRESYDGQQNKHLFLQKTK